MITQVEFLAEIEEFLRETGMAPARFGKEAVADPTLVIELRKGRDPGLRLVERINAYMRAYRVTRGMSEAAQ
jgi:predicted transcriptional regulator